MTTFNIRNHFKKIDVLDKGFVELIDGMVTEPCLKVVNAARVSYDKESKELSDKDMKLVSFLMNAGHFSTFRHSYFSFRIHMPLFVAKQAWKYQVGSAWNEEDTSLSGSIEIPDSSWNEQSFRYVEFKKQYHIPTILRKQSKINKQGSEGAIDSDVNEMLIGEYTERCNEAFELYDKMVKFGVAKEQARLVLPASVYTQCIWTLSLQSLLHFFSQRLKDDAQFEIREYAQAMKQLMVPVMGEEILK